MIPILTQSITYTGIGIGPLPDTLTCQVTHEINGEYELRMTYPTTGENYGEILIDRIIWATPDHYTREQAFRIYRITRPLNNVVTIYARHVCYDASGIIVEPFTEGSLTAAINTLPTKCVPSCPFTITSARTVATQYKIDEPRPLWRVFGGEQGSMLDVYGGEWDFDNLGADLKSRIGADRGVEIRYGKNLTQLEQDITIESTYAAVYPFWYDETSGTLVTLPEQYITIAGATGSRVMLLDLSGDFDTQPSQNDLRTRANAYIAANDPGDPKISWKINMAMLSQIEEYAGLALLDKVSLGDTVHVFYEPMNLTATARAVKLTYNVLTERYDGITLGRVKQNLAKIIVSEQNATNQKIDVAKSSLEKAIDQATDFITNGAGYMRFIYNSSNELQEIVSLENPDITVTPQNVWRWNNGGFGFSPYGYSGPFTAAITQSGAIVADFITTGTMAANRIRTGLITDEANNNSWDLDAGTLTIKNGSIDITTASSTQDKIVLRYGSNETYISPTRFSAWKDYPGQQYITESVMDNGSLLIRKAAYNTGDGTQGSFSPGGYIYQTVESGTYTPRVELQSPVSSIYSGRLMFNDSNGVLAAEYSQNWFAMYHTDGTTKLMRLDDLGLFFYDSGGTLTGKYPNTGLIKRALTTPVNYTINSSGYVSYTPPGDASGKMIIAASVYSYTSATGAFTVQTYGSNANTKYITGTPGVTINDLIIEVFYIDN